MDKSNLAALAAFLGTVLTIIVTALLFVIRQRNEQIQLIQNKISDKKFEIYSEVLTILFDIIKNQKGSKALEEFELANRLIDVKRGLIFYASDEVLNKFFQWNIEAQKGKGISHSLHFFELIVLIRKDMGNQNTNVTSDDILRSILLSDEDYIEFKRLVETS